MKLARLLATAAVLPLFAAVPALAAGNTAHPVTPAVNAPGGAESDSESITNTNTKNNTTTSSEENTSNTTTTDDTTSSDEETTNDDTSNTQGGDLVTARDPQTVIDALANAGYRAKLEKMDSGRTSIAVKISGLNTYVDFYDCDNDLKDCYTLLFNVSIDLKDGASLDDANKWNADQITGRVWLDKSNDPTLDYTVSTFEGLSPEVFDEVLKLWDTKIGDFKDFFHF